MKKQHLLLLPIYLASQNCIALDFSGYIDGAYSYMYRSDQFISGIPYISNDLNTNGFAIHQLAVVVSEQPKEGFGGVFHPILGQDAQGYAPYGMNPDIGLHDFGLTAVDAYVQYATGPFTLIAGIMEALAGYEPINPTAPKATNFSRSALTTAAVPDTLTGIRGTYVVNDKLNLNLGVSDGWDTIRDTSRPKTIELNAGYTVNHLYSFAITGMSGGERAAQKTATGPVGRRNLIDIFGHLTITPKWSLAANYDYGMQTQASLPDETIGEATWQGIAGYINYKFHPKWLASLRGEVFDDYDGYRTGVEQVWKEVTLTMGYFPTKNIGFHAEARHDFSNTDAFVDVDSVHETHNQQLLALEGYYKF
jgi:hypothetical protein